MRIKTLGQRVCSFGLTRDTVESMGVGWMLDGWLEDGDDDANQSQLSNLIGLMQSMRKAKAINPMAGRGGGWHYENHHAHLNCHHSYFHFTRVVTPIVCLPVTTMDPS